MKDSYRTVNAEAEEKAPDSVLNFYRRCLALRKSSDVLLWGTYRENPSVTVLEPYETKVLEEI